MKNLRTVISTLAAILCAGAFFGIKGSSMAKAAEEAPEAFPSVITWDDYQNTQKTEPTVLHFSLGEGTEIDVELPYYPSVVKQIEFLDINGDGTEEALIYRYFANTATEYTLIDIFEIKDKTVRNLSPGTELQELSGNVWNMSFQENAVEDFTKGEAGLVCRLESYDKKYGIVFRDETILAEYRDESWRIIGHVSWKVEQAAGLIKECVMNGK